MIKLDVQEYCHGCANFEADVKEPEKYNDRYSCSL